MPIILPEGLASAALLRSEGIEVLHQPLRSASTLRVGLLNLMPDKTATEVQFARLLGATRRHVELVQRFLGHAAISNTVKYTAMSPEPFKDIWR